MSEKLLHYVLVFCKKFFNILCVDPHLTTRPRAFKLEFDVSAAPVPRRLSNSVQEPGANVSVYSEMYKTPSAPWKVKVNLLVASVGDFTKGGRMSTLTAATALVTEPNASLATI